MCSERLEEIVNFLKAGGALGKIQIAAIGTGTAACARGLLSDLKLDAGEANLKLYTDEKREAYTNMQLYRGVRRTFTFKNPNNHKGAKDFGRQCCVRGRLPIVNAGDPWQQGATFVVQGVVGEEAKKEKGGKKTIEKNQMLYELRETSPGFPMIDQGAFLAAVQKAVPTSSSSATSTNSSSIA